MFAWTECYGTKHQLTKYVWLFALIGGVRQLFCWCITYKQILLIKSTSHRKRPWKPNAMHVTALLSSSNGEQYILNCLLIVLPCIILKQYSQCFNNLSSILSKHTSADKYSKQNQWFDKWWTSRQCCTLLCLLLRHYYMMLLTFDILPPIT